MTARAITDSSQKMGILLIHPPVVKPSEPPAGLARLAGALKENNREHMVVDANIEGLLHLLGGDVKAEDTWTRRAAQHTEDNLASLMDGRTYSTMDRYIRAVTEIDRILAFKSAPYESQVSLSNFSHRFCSPVKSRDLLKAAENPEKNVFYPYFSTRLAGLMEDIAPTVVGLSLNYLSQAIPCFAMIGQIRLMSPSVRIVLGGGLVTSWIKGLGRINPFAGLVDELVAGPGEERLLALSGLEVSSHDPFPDLSPFHQYPYLSPMRVSPFSTSTGCYWGKCSFCPEQAEGNRYLPLSAGRAAADFERLASQESPSLVHICDNALSPAILKDLSKLESETPWYGFARITSHLTDPDFCAGLKRSGCVMLKLGIESGCQSVLDALGKGIHVEDTVKALQTIHGAGIAVYAYLLFGTPPEDLDNARTTMEFIASQSDYINFLNLSIFNLPRGSREARELDAYDFSEGDLSLYQGFVHPKGWERKLVRQFLDKELKRHPAVARIIRADPPSFTSNHAPFFILNTSF